MGSISLLQWRKAYMLEFLENGAMKECFTFSVPPESEEFQFPQRITETKTFGGSVFDDYGNDSYRITLSGSTINEEKKFIYRGSKAPLYLTGTKEIFELQKIIRNWSDDIGGKDKKVFLYDLSKMSVLQIATGVASRNYWRVFIKELKIRRDKSKPKTYNYTLEMIGVEDLQEKASSVLGDIQDTVSSVTSTMERIQSVVDLTEATTAAAAEVADRCARVKLAAEMVANRDITSSLVILNVGSAADTVSRFLGGDSNSYFNSAKNLLHAVTVFKGLVGGSTSTASGKLQNASTFVISFNSNGGSGVSFQKVDYSGTVTKPIPTRPYYSFVGWYTDKELTTEYDFSSEVTESFTLYAKWVLATAKVTYNSRNGSSVSPQYVAVGETTTAPTSPTRRGYNFDTWCTDYACTTEFDFNTVITEDMTLYARWTQSYTVKFESNGGSKVESQITNIGDLVVYPKTPAKDNYTFLYWCTDSDLQNVYDFSTPITNDITLYACWVQISNTVTFNSQGGSAVESQCVVIGGYATEPTAPAKEGYDFNYWATDQAGTNEFRFASTPINANTTLYAKWTESICEVAFDSDGGSEVETQSVNYGSKAVFPAIPTKEGYAFEMWCKRIENEVDSGEVDTDGNPIMTTEYSYEEFDFSTVITEDMTLYARWFGGE